MYLNNSGELIRYANFQGYSGDTVTFTTRNPNTSSSDLVLKYEGPPPGTSLGGVTRILKTLNHNAKFSFLRLSADGNLNAYTYTSGGGGWTQTYAYFPDYHPRECALPAKCGHFGLCENNTCIGCPSPKGVLPWSPKCSPPQLGRCGSGGGERVRYYKVEGAEHFLTLLVSANPMKVSGCREMCTEDCNCKGFVYQRQESLCLTVTVLATLIRELPGESVDSGHDVYVKYY